MKQEVCIFLADDDLGHRSFMKRNLERGNVVNSIMELYPDHHGGRNGCSGGVAHCRQPGCSHCGAKPVDCDQFIYATRNLGSFLSTIQILRLD